MAKQFVTGGAGFIGSHLVERLIQMGHEVTIYDNMVSKGRGGWKDPVTHDGIQLVTADLLDFDTLKQSLAGHDFVWHLGANTDIPTGIADTELDVKHCVVATRNVLEAMHQNNIKQIVFTSSSAIYGDIEEVPTVENSGPILPISLYGAGKLGCEGFVSAYCHLFNLQAWMFRFGNVIGTRMGHGVIHDFIKKLRNNPNELEILGDGKQNKNYFLVEDCIEGMLSAVKNCKKQCDVFNLGTEDTVKVEDIARIVVEEMALQDVKFSFTGGQRGWPGDVPRVWFDLGKIKSYSWQPRYSSAEAVRIAARRLIDAEAEVVGSHV